MLTDPTLEQLLPKASCAYELAVLVSKRASQIVEGAQPMIPDQADNAVSLVCREILEDKVVGVKGNLPKSEYTVPITREARLAIEAEKKAKEERTEPAKVEAVQKPILTIDDFDKMQLQIGEVLSCEEVPKSKKLLCSQVQVAGRVLQIVSGIKNYYKPEDMVGKKVVVITNLAPAKLAGVLSEGMLLCAEDEEGRLALLTADKDVPAGSMIS